MGMHLHLIICALMCTVAAAQPGGRVVQCGDGEVGGTEQCDDANRVSGDGCNATCFFEPGYMCSSSWRDPEFENTPGVHIHVFANGSSVLDPGQVERCSGPVCATGELWKPENWVAKYAAGVELPPRGYYCGSFCKKFPTPKGYQFNDKCELEDIDECATGTALCDYNAYCTNGLVHNTSSGRGYECRCDKVFFATAVEGLGCAAAGVEIFFVIAGKKTYDATEIPSSDIAVLEGVRTTLIAAIIAEGYVKATTSAAVLAEAVLDYHVASVGSPGNVDFAGRMLYEMRVRIAGKDTNYAALSTAAMFRNFTRMNALLSDMTSSDNDAYKMHTLSRCDNDYTRSCSIDGDCLSEGVCRKDVPDVLWQSVEGSHASSAIQVASSGFNLMSIEFDITQRAWIARLRFDNTVPNVMDVLYVSHISTPVSAQERATFRPDEFPCMPVGTGDLQQLREDSLCCLYNVDRDYTTVDGFGTYLNDGEDLLGAAMAAQGSCLTRDTPPKNTTRTLLDTDRDFVQGNFARMSRSNSMIDTVVSTGYQDLIITLAEEDMRAMGGVETVIDGGYALRFFIGMAHIKTFDSTRLYSSFSHVEVTADVSNTYVFTSSAKTEFTFMRDINVDLVQIKDQEGGPALKFARVQLTVPSDVTADEATGIIPVSSALVSSGFSRITAPTPVYPCVTTYGAARRGAVDAFLERQSWCAFADDICSALGPQAVGAGGQVSFIFPLENDIWTEEDMDPSNIFPKKLYLDFIVNVRSADGKSAMTRMQTITEITGLSVLRQCEEEQTSSSVGDIIEVDMFLGLTKDLEAFNTSLIQALDITNSPTGAKMNNDASSRAANVLTMIVKGKPEVFTPTYAANYALEVEDMFTMHFLSTTKKNIVEDLIQNNAAFTQEPVPGNTDGRMRLVPTAAVLQICPIRPTRGEFGCVTRREIQERLHDSVTQSIVEISPEENVADNSSYVRSSNWLQGQLGPSEFVRNLGFAHSKVMSEKYGLNNRYRRGYMVSPTIPWRQAEMDNEGISSGIDLAQQSITFVLVAFDQNVGGVYEPAVQVAIPDISVPIPASEFSAQVQADLAAAIAAEAGSPADGTVVTPADGGDGGGGRRLLSANSDAWTHFDVRVGFPVSDTKSAHELAEHFVQRLRTDEATVLADIMRRYHSRVLALAHPAPARMMALQSLPPFGAVAAPTSVATCHDDALFELDLSALLPASVRDGKSAPTATCSSRVLRHYAGQTDTHKTRVSVRGPQSDADWGLYAHINDKAGGGERGYSFAQDPAQQHMHWLWWDLCGDVPSTGNVDAAAWQEISGKFAKACCLCHRKHPVYTGNRKRYVHEYSWPLMLDASTDLLRLDLHSAWAVNPQLASFRHSPPVAAYSVARAPPSSWTVAADGSTRFAACGAGSFRRAAEECALCARGTFQSQPRSLACSVCPAFSTSVSGAKTLSDCVCVAGYTRHASEGCVPCAAGRFKNNPGNNACTACAAGTVSRAGASDVSNCRHATGDDVHLFDAALGVLAYTSDVQLYDIALGALAFNPVAARNRRCAVVDAGLGLSCPDAHYPDVFSAPLAGVACVGASAGECAVQYTVLPESGAAPVVAEVAVFPQRGYMGPGPLGWEQSLGARAAWAAGTTLWFAPRVRVDGIDLRSRADVVRLVAVVSRHRLAHSEWEWVVCGHRMAGAGFAYGVCENKADPDNRHAVNIRNPAVLAARVFDLNGPDCCAGSQVPGEEFTGALQWTPAIRSGAGEKLWLHVFFMVGDSEACLHHGCDESAVYTDMARHVRSYELANHAVRLTLLPGSSMLLSAGGKKHTTVPMPAAVVPAQRARKVVQAFKKGAAATKGTSRKLLVAGNEPNADAASAERIITSLDNDKQVLGVLCKDKQHNCAMLDVKMDLPQDEYCMSEDMILQKYKSTVIASIHEMSIMPLEYFDVISVMRPQFASICAATVPASRRLLAESETVFESVSSDNLYLFLSDASASKYGIKTITIKLLSGNATVGKNIEICTTEDCKQDVIKGGVKQITPAPAPAPPAPAPAPPAAGTTCPGVQSLPDKAEAALKVTRISLADNAAKDTSTETFKQFAAHYLKIVAPPAKCKVLYDSVLARMKTDDVVTTSHARSLLTHSMLVAAVCAAALTAIAVGSNVFR